MCMFPVLPQSPIVMSKDWTSKYLQKTHNQSYMAPPKIFKLIIVAPRSTILATTARDCVALASENNLGRVLADIHSYITIFLFL